MTQSAQRVPSPADELRAPAGRHERIVIENDVVHVTFPDGESQCWPIGSPEGFEILSRLWLRAGWDVKHVYSFTWLGRPIIQLPEDLLRLQEAIWRVQPDVIIETGVAHGGGLVFSASMCAMTGNGRVIGVEVALRDENRAAIETHPLAHLISIVDGSSIDQTVVAAVRGMISDSDRVMVLLDARHTRDHVRAELEAYGPLVSPDSYLVAMDGIMRDVAGAERTEDDWSWNHPVAAVDEFLEDHPEFIREAQPFQFNEGRVRQPVTYWPGGWLKRIDEQDATTPADVSGRR